MKRQRSVKREIIGAVLSIAVSFIGAVDLLGHPARMVHILTIFAGGLGAGVTLQRIRDRVRAERANQSSTRSPSEDDTIR